MRRKYVIHQDSVFDPADLYEVGETWAEIREGYRGPIWVRERYDWSVPGRVEFTAVDSGFAAPGSYVVVDINAVSRVILVLERCAQNAKSSFVLSLSTNVRP